MITHLIFRILLRRMLLKSLRNFHTSLSKNAELKDLLRNIEILFNKELYPNCQTELKKAEKMAREFELTTGLIEVLGWKRKLEQSQNPYNYNYIDETVAEQKIAIEHLKNINDYWQLATRITRSMAKRNVEEIQHVELLQNSNNARTLEAKVLHFNSLYLKELAQEHVEIAEKALSDLVALFEANPAQLHEEIGLYASTVNNLVSFWVFMKRKEDALQLIEKAKMTYTRVSISSENKTLLKHILRTYNVELEIYREVEHLKPHLPFIRRTETFIHENRHKMPKQYLISFWFQLASIYFKLNHFDQSLHWINHILNAKIKTDFFELQVHARMLNLIVHFEQKNLFVLLYFVDGTRRFIRKVRELEPYEKTLLRFFAKICDTSIFEQENEFSKLYHTLFPSHSGARISNTVLDYLDYKKWIASKI